MKTDRAARRHSHHHGERDLCLSEPRRASLQKDRRIRPIRITAGKSKTKTLPLPPSLAGAIALAVGLAWLVIGRKKAGYRVKPINYEEEVGMTEKRKAYEEKLEAQIKEWTAQITLFKAKADKAKAAAKIEYYTTIETLQHRRDKVKGKLQELRAAAPEAWEDLKTGAEKAWAEVKTVFQEALAKFK